MQGRWISRQAGQGNASTGNQRTGLRHWHRQSGPGVLQSASRKSALGTWKLISASLFSNKTCIGKQPVGIFRLGLKRKTSSTSALCWFVVFQRPKFGLFSSCPSILQSSDQNTAAEMHESFVILSLVYQQHGSATPKGIPETWPHNGQAWDLSFELVTGPELQASPNIPISQRSN